MFDEEDDDTDAEKAGVKEAVKTTLVALDLALDGDLRLQAPAVFIPPGVRPAFAQNRIEREILEERLKESFGSVDYENQLLRIERDLDPIGMAIAIAQGMAIPVFVPDAKGGVKVSYVQPSTRERMKVLHKLIDRAMPAKSPVKTPEAKPPGEGGTDPVAFLALVQRAAQLARETMNGATLIDASAETRDASYVETDLVETAPDSRSE